MKLIILLLVFSSVNSGLAPVHGVGTQDNKIKDEDLMNVLQQSQVENQLNVKLKGR